MTFTSWPGTPDAYASNIVPGTLALAVGPITVLAVAFSAGAPSEQLVSVESTLPIFVGIGANTPDGNTYNPTSDPVSFAFLTTGTSPSASTVWISGSWTTTGAGYTAQVIVGAGGVEFTAGEEYTLWVRVQDADGNAVLAAGFVTAY